MRTPKVKIAAGAYTASVLALGYACFGFWTMLIFSSGFLTGYLLWLRFPHQPDFSALRWPFWISLVFFVVHRIEEKTMGFFAALSGITGVATPAIDSVRVIVLVVVSVGGWLLIPSLIKRGHAFGYYLAWTFFSAMGVTELAHYVLPLFVDGPYAYFPGMMSVVVLAPLGWWGMGELAGDLREGDSTHEVRHGH